MDQMDWDKLKTFHAAAEAQSLTGAAERLNISQSAVSRQIQALEDSLNTPLFHRHARGLTLTEQGHILLQAAHDMAHAASLGEANVRDSREKPQGRLRIAAPFALGSNWLTNVLPEFLALYPDIEVELILADEDHDFSTFAVDVAIRPWSSTQADLIQRKFLRVSQSLYASLTYLNSREAPLTAADLDNHAIIGFESPIPSRMRGLNWALRVGKQDSQPRKAALWVNNLHGVMRAAEAGIGIAGLPDYLVHNNRRLVRVLPEVSGAPVDMYFAYPSELRGSNRVNAFRDYLYRVAHEIDERSNTPE